MDMKPDMNTFFEYIDSSGRNRSKKTNQFRDKTSLDDIIKWIGTWYKAGGGFHLEIKLQNEVIDFDQEYITEYKPFAVTQSTKAIPSDSLRVELKIVEDLSKIFYSDLYSLMSFSER